VIDQRLLHFERPRKLAEFLKLISGGRGEREMSARKPNRTRLSNSISVKSSKRGSSYLLIKQP